MYKTAEEMTVQELLLDAYKDQITTYVRLLSIKDEQVALLKTHIEGLEKELEHCRVNHQSSTSLTAKEREEIAKLSKEILEERIRDLEIKLNRYKCDNTGLTAKEREEIAKLSKEIMDEPLEVNEWPEEINMTIEIDNKIVTELVLNALGIKVGSKENTTTANSDAKEKKGMSLTDYFDSIKYEV